MKKIIAMLLAITMCISLCSCGGRANNKIGETYTSHGIEFTLNYVEFTDVMDNWGGANDTYWMPVSEVDRERQLDKLVSPQSPDDTICVISYTAKNVSKNNKTIDDIGTLDYDNGYTYSDGGLCYRVSPTGVWQEIPNGLTLEKLKENAYEFRAYMVVPKKIVTDTDKTLTYELFEKEFNLR